MKKTKSFLKHTILTLKFYCILFLIKCMKPSYKLVLITKKFHL